MLPGFPIKLLPAHTPFLTRPPLRTDNDAVRMPQGHSPQMGGAHYSPRTQSSQGPASIAFVQTQCGISANLLSQLFQHLCSSVSDGFILICQGLLQEADGILAADFPEGFYCRLPDRGIFVL